MIHVAALCAVPETTTVYGVPPFAAAVVFLPLYEDRVPDAGKAMFLSPDGMCKATVDLPVACQGIGGSPVGV